MAFIHAITKRELLEKLSRFSDDDKVYIGGQFKEGNAISVYASPIIDVESANVYCRPAILLIENEDA